MVMSSYKGRKFVNPDWYQLLDRTAAYLADNKVWLVTIDLIYELDDDDEPIEEDIVRLSKWRAINREEDDGSETKIWRPVSGYNIRNEKDWPAMEEQINRYMFSSGSKKVIPEDEYERLLQKESQIPELKGLIQDLKNEKEVYAGELEMYRKRLNIMQANIREYESVLDELENLIEDEDTTETEVHDFIEENEAHWLFGLEYIGIENEVQFPPGTDKLRFDSMLKRHDEFWDLVELKGPNENLFDQRTKLRSKPNAKLSEAIGQVFTYLRACDEENLNDLFKPRAMIVIGKERTDDIEERRLFSSHISNVELLTYTDLLEKGRKLIEHLDTPNETEN